MISFLPQRKPADLDSRCAVHEAKGKRVAGLEAIAGRADLTHSRACGRRSRRLGTANSIAWARSPRVKGAKCLQMLQRQEVVTGEEFLVPVVVIELARKDRKVYAYWALESCCDDEEICLVVAEEVLDYDEEGAGAVEPPLWPW